MESLDLLSSKIKGLFKPRSRSKPPIWLRFRSSTLLICLTIYLATFTDGFVYGVIVPVLPFSLVERSGIPESEVQFWTSTFLVLHGVAMAFASPVAGWLADRGSSRKPPFFGGLAILFLSTSLFAVGTSPAILVVARCLQGASAGVVFTVGLAMLIDTVGRDEVGSWMGVTLSGMSTGVMIGPLLGGLIYEKVGYYAVFVVVLAITTVDLILQLFMIEKSTARTWLRSTGESTHYGTINNKRDDDDVARPAVSTGDREPQEDQSRLSSESYHEEDPLIHETHERERSGVSKRLAARFPTTYALMTSGRLVAAMYGGFVQISIICSFDSILPIFVHRTFGWGSSATGLIFLAISIPSLVAPLVGLLSDRVGTRIVVLVGFAVSTVVLALLALVSYNSIQQKVLLGALLAMTGLALTMILSPLATDMFSVVEKMGKDNEGLFGPAGAYAQAYGLFDIALAFGSIFGPTYAGVVYEKAGWRVAVWALAAFCASGSIPVLYFTGPQTHETKDDEAQR